MDLLNDERGVFSFVFVFAIIIIILAFFFVVAIPIVQQMQAQSFVIGEPVLEDTNALIATLNNGVVKTQAQSAINEQQNASATNFEILSFLSQWAWVFILIVLAMAYLLTTRRNVEFGGGF